MTQDITSAEVLTTPEGTPISFIDGDRPCRTEPDPAPADDEPTQPCADTVALGLLWQKIEQMVETQKELARLLEEAKTLELQALETMTKGVAVFVWPGLIAIASDGDHPICFYPVEGAP